MSTWKFKVWSLLTKPACACELARKHNLDMKKTHAAFRALYKTKHTLACGKRGRTVLYCVSGKPLLPDGRGHSEGSREARKLGPKFRPKVKRMAKESERRNEKPIAEGYGSGKTELELAWPPI